jgi:hypothetical protein
VTAYRYDGHEINENLAKSEAAILHEAIKDKTFNHEEVIRILTTRSKAQLKASFNRYRDEHGKSITKVQILNPSLYIDLTLQENTSKTIIRYATSCFLTLNISA